VTRNYGAAVDRGDYLYILDDGDWLLPGALERFWQVTQRDSNAVWLYGGIQVIDTNGRCLAEINSGLTGNSFAQVVGGAWVPLQVSLVKAKAFFAVGGFDPLICGTEDLDLCRRIALHGDFANVPAAVGCLLRDVNWGSSTDYVRGVEDNRRSRDKLLDQPGALAQLRASAGSSYWHGRVVHVYVSAILLNLRRGRLFTAMSRLVFCLMSFVWAGSYIFSASFWRAVRADQVPNSLYDVLLALEREPREQKTEAD
jgi:GT2 family glycosyltransferase